LLFLDPPTALQRQTQRPFQHLVGNRDLRIRRHQLDESADGLLDARRVTSAQGATQVNAPLEHVLPALAPQLVPAFREEVADQTEVIGQQVAVDLWQIPARQVGVDAVHESGVVAHLGRQRAKQMADALLVLHVHLEVAHHHHTAVGANALLATTELAGLHVALHDVHAILLVEGDAGDLIEADHVVLADQAALTVWRC
jgi:hypothetical protein